MHNRIKQGAALLLAGLLAFSLAGCGHADRTSGSSASKLVVYSAGPKDLAEKIQKGFEAKTGIKVEMYQATTGKILSRVAAEKNAPFADVVVLASLPAARQLADSDMLRAYPKAQHADQLFADWADPKGRYFCYSASALGIVYNTKLVKTPPTAWSDLTKEEWRDRVTIPDPALSGSALDFMTGYLSVHEPEGWQMFEGYGSNGARLGGANQEVLSQVVTGAKSVVVAGVDYMTYQAKAKGEPVDIVYPHDGTVISPRPAAILKSSKNTAAAEAFIDYLLSDEGQQLVATACLLPGRQDIETQNRPSVAQIPALKVNWEWMDVNSDAVIKKISQIYQ